MPRHLDSYLDAVAALPETPSDLVSARPPAMAAYAGQLWSWGLLDLPLSEAQQRRVAELQQARPDAAGMTWGLVATVPCVPFRRALVRVIERSDRAPALFDHRRWFEAFPDVERWLRDLCRQRAGRFNTPDVAIPAAVTWARYLGGGEEAWRQAANALHRLERREARLRLHAADRGERFRSRLQHWHHEIEDHGYLSLEEGAQLNAQLDALGAAPVPLLTRGQGGQALAPDAWIRDAWPVACLCDLAIASKAFAGARWGEEDLRFFAERLAGERVPDYLRPELPPELLERLQRDP